jgi:hypothetical protein
MRKVTIKTHRGKTFSPAIRRGNQSTSLQTYIEKAQRRLPLPKLLADLGYPLSNTMTMHCPFHDDHNPSFSVFRHGESGDWLWKCFAGCGCGDAISFLVQKNGESRSAAMLGYLRRAGVVIKWKGGTH